MKKLLIAVAVALFACALAVPAWADVDAEADVRVSKDVLIVERILKLKGVLIGVLFLERADGAAEALALVNQVNVDNDAEVDMSDGPDGFADDSLDALIGGEEGVGGSISGNIGITQVNQDVGLGANQGNVAVVAVTDADTSVVDAQSAVEQINASNEADLDGPFSPEDPERTAKIIGDSVSGNVGITQVNQNAGNWNNQVNTLAVAIGEDDGAILALADSFLGQVNANNRVDALTTIKTDMIVDSVNNNSGVTSVNQTTGNMINQATTITFSGIAALGLSGNPAQIP